MIIAFDAKFWQMNMCFPTVIDGIDSEIVYVFENDGISFV